MTNDSNPLKPVQTSNPVFDENEKRLLPILKMDVGVIDKTFSNSVINTEPFKETLFAFYCLLYEKVIKFEKDPNKHPLVYQKLCRYLGFEPALIVFPQMESIRQTGQKYCSFIDKMIPAISSEIDQNMELGTGGGNRNPSLTLQLQQQREDFFSRLNTHHHDLMNCGQLCVFKQNRLNDFVNYGMIERGGFGRVFLMQNTTDKCFYAIKLIPFRSKDQVKATKIVQEVILFANLPTHQNIVSYKGSWVESYVKTYGPAANSCQSINQIESLTPLEQSSSSSSSESTNFNFSNLSIAALAKTYDVSTQSTKSAFCQYLPLSEIPSTDPFISLPADLPCGIPPEPAPGTYSGCSDSSTLTAQSGQFDQSTQPKEPPEPEVIPESGVESESDLLPEPTKVDDKSKKKSDITKAPVFYCVLFIQMELCKFNLRTWIDKRNAEVKQKNLASVDYDAAIDIIIQILRGVKHLHDHNLIHRDIKPQNILFSSSGVVKIADFGLTTINDLPEYLSGVKKEAPGKKRKRTQGLGTKTYSAPEQLKTDSYGRKADIYSFGLIAYELLHPIFTDMEKAERFEKLKSLQILPEELTKHKYLADLILKCVQNDPDARPEASEILDNEESLRHGWKINLNQQSYADLVILVKDLNTRVTELTDLVRARDEEIAGLKKKLSSKESDENNKNDEINH